MSKHEGEAMGRQTDLVLDASLPKHKNTQYLSWLNCDGSTKFGSYDVQILDVQM